MSQGRSVTILASTPYSTNILVRLLILIMKNFLTQQIRKCATLYSSNSIENATPL